MKYTTFNMKNQKGIATLEIIIAMVLIVLAISAVLPLVSSSQSASVDSETNQEALYKAEALLENARAAAKLDFNLVNPVSATGDSIYQKSLSVEQVGLYTKKVTSHVTWDAEGNRNLNIQLSTLLTNASGVDTAGPSTCSSVLTGEWSNAQTTSISVADSVGGNPVTGVDARDGKLYVTTANLQGAAANDFYIYDISQNPKNPTLIKAINTGSGLKGVAVAEDYAYVANTSRTAQLQVIDIHNANNPTVIANYKLTNVTGTGSQALGNTIFYANKKVYLGLTAAATGPEFNVINVSNPNVPVRIGSYDIGQTVNSIFVKNTFAYVASADTEELKVLDISNPAGGISEVGGVNETTGTGSTVYGVGDTTYLGTTTTSNQFYILDDSKITTTSNSGEINPPLLERSGLTAVITYEQSAGGASVASRSYYRGITNTQLTTKIPGGPSAQKNDFATGAEFYDLYTSDANGTPNPKGVYFTIDVYTPGGKPNIGSGGNIDAVELRFQNGTSMYANSVARVVNGTDLSGDYTTTHGYASRALGKPDSRGLTGITYLGNQHASLTLGFPAMPVSPVIASVDVGNQGVLGILVRDYLAFVTTTSQVQIYNIADAPETGKIPAPIKVIETSNGQQITTGTSIECEGNYLYLASHDTSNNQGSITIIYPGT